MSRSVLCTAAAVIVLSMSSSAHQAPVVQGPKTEIPNPAAIQRNMKIDVTLSEPRDAAGAPAKTLSLVVADRENARIRATTAGDGYILNLDARPELGRDGRIKLYVSVEYRPQRAETERHMLLSLSETLVVVVDDGKPLVVSQTPDPASSRMVQIELKATLLK